MDLDEMFANRPGDPLILLLKQDIDHLSVEELRGRVEALTGEISRCEAKISFAGNHRSTADSLFKK